MPDERTMPERKPGKKEAQPRPARGAAVVYAAMANAASTGVLHGNTITLDAPVPPLEGQRVRVLIALADDDVQLRPEQQAEAWR